MTRGINLEGICRNQHCRVHLNKIIWQIGMEEFDFKRDRQLVYCPMCHRPITADTCLLINCVSRFAKLRIISSAPMKPIKHSGKYSSIGRPFVFDIRLKMKEQQLSQFKVMPVPSNQFEPHLTFQSVQNAGSWMDQNITYTSVTHFNNSSPNLLQFENHNHYSNRY